MLKNTRVFILEQLKVILNSHAGKGAFFRPLQVKANLLHTNFLYFNQEIALHRKS